jgi:hypothetical protein
MPALPLTPIERYFFHDHRKSHPAWIRYEFTFRGVFDRAALARAWAQLAQRHPLTGATVAKRRWGGPVWKLNAVPPELVWLEAGAADDGRNDERDLHDLSARAGLRGEVCPGATETKFTLLMHHAVTDGLGALSIAEDFFTLYAIERGVAITLPLLPPLDARRDRGSPTTQGTREPLLWIWLGVVWGIVLGWQRVVELRGTNGERGRRELATRSCSEAETLQLRKAGQAANASVNELLIRDAQVALGAWLPRHGAAAPEAWTRILVPVYVGGPRTEPRCSAPALGVMFIERRVRSLGRRARLLVRAHEDMEFIRERGLARVFRASMFLRGLIPGQIARHCRRAGARSTLVLSNLGRVFGRGPLVRPDGVLVLPGAELTDFAGWGPCRPGTNAFVTTGIFRGRQSFWISYDPAAMSAAQAGDFADELEAQVRRSLAGE